MNKKQLTINDIAQIAGVAKSTVSRYLNGGSISEKTKLKIKEVIDKYNYEPNTFAQSLKAKKTKFIGIIVPRLDSIVTSRVIMSIDNELKSLGYNSLIINTNLNIKREIDNLINLERLKVDGIILIATEITKEHEKIIKDSKVPVVVVGQRCKNSTSILNNDYEAGNFMANYVLKKNHKKIIYLGVDEKDESVGIMRKKGVINRLKLDKEVEFRIIDLDFSIKSAENEIKNNIWGLKETAIICATDNIALGVIKAISDKNINKKISVCGFGGYDISKVLNPRLTTIKFDNDEVSKKVTSSILNMIDNKEVEKIQTVDFKFIEGGSVFENR